MRQALSPLKSSSLAEGGRGEHINQQLRYVYCDGFNDSKVNELSENGGLVSTRHSNHITPEFWEKSHSGKISIPSQHSRSQNA